MARVLGFVRERVFAHYFGNSATAGAFRAALRIPNVIRNLLGEGTLSASFIPVYAGMIERGETENARRLAGTIASLLVLLTGMAAVAGILLAPVITSAVAPGFSGPTRELTVTLVKILFPMSGIMILAAWCLGVLNTHRRFFLSYSAPALWNIAQIGTLIALGSMLAGADLAVALAFGAVGGSVLQLAAQLPSALRLAGRVSWSLSLETPGVRRVIRAWAPVVFGAGVVQISGIIDTQLASLLGPDSVAVLGYAQLIAILPVSLFGVSFAAVALPELSRDAAAANSEAVRERLARGARRVTFFMLPSAFAFATLGTPIVAVLFQTGRFTADDTAVVAGVLAAYALALWAQASVKLLASGFYALGDTGTPVRFAAVSVVLSASSGYLLMQHFGPAGIALGAAIGASTNVGLLQRSLVTRVGAIMGTRERRSLVVAGAGAAVAAVAAGMAAAKLGDQAAWVVALTGLAIFGVVYGVITYALKHPEMRALLSAARIR